MSDPQSFEASRASNETDVVYVGYRQRGRTIVEKRPSQEQLTPDRSLELANHSPSGFEWGYGGSGPAQLALALLLDYTDDEEVALAAYMAFKTKVVSQLACTGPADCWHLTGDDIDAALATITDDVVSVPDGGQLAPSLPANWRAVSRPDRQVFQRNDRDHYIVLGDGGDEWLVILCSQGDRAYPAPLAHRTVAVDTGVAQVIQELAEESNDLIEPTILTRNASTLTGKNRVVASSTSGLPAAASVRFIAMTSRYDTARSAVRGARPYRIDHP